MQSVFPRALARSNKIRLLGNQAIFWNNASQFRCLCKAKTNETEVVKQLRSRIKTTGPVSVASYIKEALCNPMAVRAFTIDIFSLNLIEHVYIMSLVIWFDSRQEPHRLRHYDFVF